MIPNLGAVVQHEHIGDMDGLSRVVDLDEIASNDYNLNLPLYVAPAEAGEKLTLEQAVVDLEAAHARVVDTRSILEAEFAKWGMSV